MRLWSLVLVILILLTGCEYEPPPIEITATPQQCGIWENDTSSVYCVFTSEGVLAQSGADQTILTSYGISVVIRGTAYLINTNTEIEIFALEGSVVVSARGQTRVLSGGQRVQVPLLAAQADFPEDIMSILERPRNLPLDILPRSIDRDAFVLTLTPRPTVIPTSVPDRCPVPDGWFGEYTIERGDTLAAIADNFATTVEDIADANCLTNIARITVGDVLRVPSDDEPILASAIGFRADNYAVAAGDCTILRWDAFGARAITLDGEAVRESSNQEVCLEETQSFVLRVTFSVEQEESRELTISVEE